MISTLLRSALLSIILISTGLMAAPTSFQANYEVVKSGLNLGEMHANLVYSGNEYTYLKLTEASGLAAFISGDKLTERSAGLRLGQRLQAQHYLRHHKNKRKDRRDQFDFATPTQVKGSYKEAAYALTVPSGTLDPVVLELQIMADLSAGRALNYQVTEKGTLKEYRFQRQGRELLTVPAGQYLCEKIRVVRDNGERTTTIWLAAELDFLPVKVRHNEEGDIIETRLKSYQKR